MSGSTDDLPIDGIALDEIERLKSEFKLDEARARLIEAILKGMPVVGIGNKITQDYWLAHVLADVENKDSPLLHSQALRMLGMYLGILSDKKGPATKKKVVFDESPD